MNTTKTPVLKIPISQRFAWKKGVWVSKINSALEIQKGVRSKKKFTERDAFPSIDTLVQPICSSRFGLWIRFANRASVWAYGYAKLQCGGSARGLFLFVDVYELGERIRPVVDADLDWERYGLDHRSLIYDTTPQPSSVAPIFWVYFKRRHHVLKDESAATFLIILV